MSAGTTRVPMSLIFACGRGAVSSANHVHLANGLLHHAASRPTAGEEGQRVRKDLDALAAFVHVGASAIEEVAELIAGHHAMPGPWSTGPNPALGAAITVAAEQHPGGARAAFDHGGDDAPFFQWAD